MLDNLNGGAPVINTEGEKKVVDIS